MPIHRKETPGYWRVHPEEIEVDGKPALYFANRNKILTKEEFYEMMELAKRFYDTEGVEDWIKTQGEEN